MFLSSLSRAARRLAKSRSVCVMDVLSSAFVHSSADFAPLRYAAETLSMVFSADTIDLSDSLIRVANIAKALAVRPMAIPTGPPSAAVATDSPRAAVVAAAISARMARKPATRRRTAATPLAAPRPTNAMAIRSRLSSTPMSILIMPEMAAPIRSNQTCAASLFRYSCSSRNASEKASSVPASAMELRPACMAVVNLPISA